MARIGFFGGSFNPPTIAHKALADLAFSALRLDTLWLNVTPENPLKDSKTLAPFEHRMQMVELMLADRPHMKASDIEKQLGSSYTVNTVRHLDQLYPDDELFLFMGGDNWQNFHRWGEGHEEILDHVAIVVFQRPGYHDLMNTPSYETFKPIFVDSADDLQTPKAWTILSSGDMDVAATKVREAAAKGEKHPHITDDVWDYIKEHKLYGLQ